MYLYLCAVLYVTILPIDFTFDFKWLYHESVTVDYGNIIPFEDLLLHRTGALRGVLLNIVMTIPFGFLLPILSSKTHLIKVLLSTFMLSLGIEIIQLVMTIFLLNHRAFDVTDLITNTIGGVVGYIVYRLLSSTELFKKLTKV